MGSLIILQQLDGKQLYSYFPNPQGDTKMIPTSLDFHIQKSIYERTKFLYIYKNLYSS